VGLISLCKNNCVFFKLDRRISKHLLTVLGIGSILLGGGIANAASVRDFGARGDGYTDDTRSIQQAVDTMASGTITFPAGTYIVRSPIHLHGDSTYSGEGNPILTGTNGNSIFIFPYSNANNITVSGFVFDNGQIRTEGKGEVPKNVHITGNTFQNLTVRSGNWTINSAIFGDGGLSQSSIDNNTFKNIMANGSTRPDGTSNSIDEISFAIFEYGLDRTNIDNNIFDFVGEGIRVCFSQTYPSTDVHVGSNIMTRIHRMGMEMQGAQGCGAAKPSIDGPSTNNIIIENNSITNWVDPYWGSFGISFAAPGPYGGNGVTIRNNLIAGTQTPYWETYGSRANYGYGLETAGLGLQVYGNVISGYYGQAITVAEGSTNALIHDNYSCALGEGATMGIGPETGPSTGAQYYSNTILPSCPAQLPAIQGPSLTTEASIPATPVAPSVK
jgi:pectate lyase-like protein